MSGLEKQNGGSKGVPVQEGPKNESFYHSQTRAYEEEKSKLGQFILSEFNIVGSGLIFDAGSSCYLLFRKFIKKIIETSYDSYFSVLTNSLPVVSEWQSHMHLPKIRNIQLELYGSKLDVDHGAFYDSDFIAETEKKLLSKHFHARHVYVGSSGIELTRDGRFLFGVHAPWEIKTKSLLFQCSCKIRFILLTPNKIGTVGGGYVFDLFDIDNAEMEAPIVLISTPPNSEQVERQYNRTKAIFKSEEFNKKVRRKQMTIHWLTIGETKYGKFEHEVVSFEESSDDVKKALFDR